MVSTDGMTRFVWADGSETWHRTFDTPYYPRWTVDVAADHATLPPGRHEFVLMKDEPCCYYREITDAQEDEEATS